MHCVLGWFTCSVVCSRGELHGGDLRVHHFSDLFLGAEYEHLGISVLIPLNVDDAALSPHIVQTSFGTAARLSGSVVGVVC